VNYFNRNDLIYGRNNSKAVEKMEFLYGNSLRKTEKLEHSNCLSKSEIYNEG
jgi:hypothetical protein